MRVTEKGQVTIPKNVRQRLGIRPGSDVEFALDNDQAVLRLARRDDETVERDVRDLVGHIQRHKGTMTLGNMDRDMFLKMLRE